MNKVVCLSIYLSTSSAKLPGPKLPGLQNTDGKSQQVGGYGHWLSERGLAALEVASQRAHQDGELFGRGHLRVVCELDGRGILARDDGACVNRL